MKKMITMFAMLLLLPFATAEEIEVNAGMTPDNPFYRFDVLWDEMKIKFAASNGARARMRLIVAQERLAELTEMVNQGKLQAMKRAQQEEKTQTRMVGELVNEIEDDIKKADIQERLYKHIMVLEELETTLPAEAHSGLSIALRDAKEIFYDNQKQITEGSRPVISEIKSNIASGRIRINR